ncbi:MAG: DegV family protein [Clostridia bacterium]
MKTFIFTDITSDIPQDISAKYTDFEILPFSFSLDDDHYDNINNFLPIQEFYERMKKGAKATTSMLSQYLCNEKMEEKLSAGYDVLYISFSSALSGTFNAASLVARELKEKYPDRKIQVIDSLNASSGEGLLINYVVKKRDSGATFDELVQYTTDILDHVCSYFSVDDLKHLARMGRVSKTAAFIGEIAQIKPVLYVNKLGELVPITKVMSRRKVYRALIDKMEEKMLPIAEQNLIYIGHGACFDDATLLKNMLLEKFGSNLDIVITDIGSVIGSHTNAGVIALFFLGKDKIEAKDANVSNLKA